MRNEPLFRTVILVAAKFHLSDTSENRDKLPRPMYYNRSAYLQYNLPGRTQIKIPKKINEIAPCKTIQLLRGKCHRPDT